MILKSITKYASHLHFMEMMSSNVAKWCHHIATSVTSQPVDYVHDVIFCYIVCGSIYKLHDLIGIRDYWINYQLACHPYHEKGTCSYRSYTSHQASSMHIKFKIKQTKLWNWKDMPFDKLYIHIFLKMQPHWFHLFIWKKNPYFGWAYLR